MKQKGLVVFLISDFIDDNFRKSFLAVAHKHTLVPIVCLDPLEIVFPSVGFLSLIDYETDEVVELDLRKKSANQLNDFFTYRLSRHQAFFKTCGTRTLSINTKQDFVNDVLSFFAGYV